MSRGKEPVRAAWFTTFFDRAYVAQLREEKSPAQTRHEIDFILRALRPPRGARILDVPCGYGRHAAGLARRGFRVVGVDLSRAMLAEARRRFVERPRLTFVRGDMRRIAFRAEFDAVVNLYTSFGYFTPAQNRAVLRRLARALRPGGRLLIDHRDPVYDATLPRRPWYQHQIYAPGFYTGYGVKTLPGIREGIEERHWQEAQENIDAATQSLQAYTQQVNEAIGLLK